MEYTSGAASWGKVLRRAMVALLPSRSGRRRTGWSIGVPVIAIAAGLLFTTSATTADGTSLRDDRRPRLAQLINDVDHQVADREAEAAALRATVEAQTAALAGSDGPVAEQRELADRFQQPAGFGALRGPGLSVELNDAPPNFNPPKSANPDDLVVHQGDVQAVVNALWAGGAEAMSIMNVRVISTGAILCVGNTLLLHGQVYSPPFKITVIGDPAAMQRSLNASAGVRLFRQAVADHQLGYKETLETNVTVPAYAGSSTLRQARVPR